MTLREIIEPLNRKINTSRNFSLPHSPAVRAGDFLFLSGMVAIDPETGDLSPGTVTSETRQILTNMEHLLLSAETSLARVIKVNVMLADIAQIESMYAVYRNFFPVDPPAQTICGVQLSNGLNIEIECIALASDQSSGSSLPPSGVG